MKAQIPTVPLATLAGEPSRRSSAPLEVYMVDHRRPHAPPRFEVPYRSNYYGVGLTLSGRGQITADLEDLALGPRRVLALPPQTIKRWRHLSADFTHVAVFFTPRYLADRTRLDPERFAFFAAGRHVLDLPEPEAANVAAALQTLRHHYDGTHPHRDEILQSLIRALLFELQGYGPPGGGSPAAMGGRGARLTTEFKRLLSRHFATERQVTFYAARLFVTPRHLSAAVKAQTGRTAGEWIDEAVLLEARVLLRDASLSVAQVAESLRFPDPSTFGKFFKNLTGWSPSTYRRRVEIDPTF